MARLWSVNALAGVRAASSGRFSRHATHCSKIKKIGDTLSSMNKKRLLVCMFTYNRPDLLRNAVRAADRFFPYGDRMILDDASTDPRAQACLRELSADGRWKVYINPNRKRRTFGGLYQNFKYALNYALERDYDYCLFLEDDGQFVWKKEDYLESVERVFATCPDAVQLAPWFTLRILPPFVQRETGSFDWRHGVTTFTKR